MKRILVCGAGGFIGSHLVEHLKNEGAWVRGVDLKHPEFGKSAADEFIQGDLRDPVLCRDVIDIQYDEVYQLAADMGGAGFVFTGDNDAEIMHNSALVNLNVLDACWKQGVGRIFYSSSACVYPQHNQEDPDNPLCSEESVYPANPDSDYGWEKLFSERLYLAYGRNHGMKVRVARYHNIFGPKGTWCGGREKAPAALCRKVAMLQNGESLEMWGDGEQTRSFLYIDECLRATVDLVRSDFTGPMNIGSEEMVSINRLAEMVLSIAGKTAVIQHIPGPEGVRGRNSDNSLMRGKTGLGTNAFLISGFEGNLYMDTAASGGLKNCLSGNKSAAKLIVYFVAWKSHGLISKRSEKSFYKKPRFLPEPALSAVEGVELTLNILVYSKKKNIFVLEGQGR